MEVDFQPYRGAHALVESVFYLNFAPHLDEGQLRLLGNPFPELSDLLPEHNPLKSIQLKLDQTGSQSVSESPAGAEYSRLRSDGLNEWVVRIEAQALSIHCLEYTRWDEIWPKAKKIMLVVLERIASGTTISAIGLKNIDRFDFSGTEEQYDISGLFNLQSPKIPAEVADKGPLWHAHLGWFHNIAADNDLQGDAIQTLNQLNLAGSKERTPSGSKYFVSIDQNLMLRGEAEDQLTVANKDHDYIDNVFRAFHQLNKDTLGELLTEPMRKRINLRRKRN